MTLALTKAITRLTCQPCQGNGMFGGRSLKRVAGLDYYQSEARVCEDCKGTGLNGAWAIVANPHWTPA